MFDVFISYSSADRPEAKEIADSLTRNGVRVWFDAWEMKPGQSLIDKISDGISKSSYLFALLSDRSCASNWVRQELRQAMNDEVTGGHVKVVPITITDARCRSSCKISSTSI